MYVQDGEGYSPFLMFLLYTSQIIKTYFKNIYTNTLVSFSISFNGEDLNSFKIGGCSISFYVPFSRWPFGKSISNK